MKERKNTPYRQIRAYYDDRTIRVYQAYSDRIADSALAAGTFASPPFSLTRMTWIKPSFLWMMYRAGWGFKDDGQKRILGLDLSRSGFEEALAGGVLAMHSPEAGLGENEWKAALARSQVRIQWDPERDLNLQSIGVRSIQIGLRGRAVEDYVNRWIVAVSDLTDLAHRIKKLVDSGDYDQAAELLPEERPYPLSAALARTIGAD